jgi:hypothetical protein
MNESKFRLWREAYADYTISAELPDTTVPQQPVRVTVDFFKEPSTWTALFECTSEPKALGFEVRTKENLRPKFSYSLGHGGVLVLEVCPRSIQTVVHDLMVAGDLKRYFISSEPPLSAWRRLDWKPVTVALDAAKPFQAAVQEVYANGGMLFGALAPTDKEKAQELQQASYGVLGEEFWLAFLSSPALAELFPGLKPIWERLKQEQFEQIDAFTLAGNWTSLLVHGGAYRDYRDRVVEAKAIATAFAQSIVPTNIHSIRSGWRYTIHRMPRATPWADWFKGVAWDYTYLIYDELRQIAYFMTITDTD